MKFATLLLSFTGLFITPYANAFDCITTTTAIGQGGGSADVYVKITPEIQSNQNLVVDLSSQISCKNRKPERYVDIISLKDGSSYQGALMNFRGTINFNGVNYPFPLMSETSNTVEYTSTNYTPFPTVLYLSPNKDASGVVIKANSHIATVNMRQRNYCPSDPSAFDCNHDFIYSWRIFASNDVTIPTGGCEVASDDINVTLPAYEEGKNTYSGATIGVRCPSGYKLLNYYISGDTISGSNTIFKNTARFNAAKGVGITFKYNGNALVNGRSIYYGFVGPYSDNKYINISYESVPGEMVTAGNVQTMVFFNFIYN